MASEQQTVNLEIDVDVPIGGYYRGSDGVWTRGYRTERVVAEITLAAGGLDYLAERAAKSKNGRAQIGPLKARILERKGAQA
jgi:hypothetical protein